MTSKLKLFVACNVSAIAIAGATPAIAADLGTNAGVDITNQVSVAYDVGGVNQTAVTDSDTFTVDRKVNLLVSEANSAATTVSPNGQDQVLTYTVRNLTNDTIDVLLSANQLAGAAAAHGGTDNFDVDNLQIFVDSNGNGTYDVGVDTASVIEDLLEDETATVFIVGDIPSNRVQGDIATVELVGTAADATTGTAFAETTGANTAGIDNVFADADGDGQDSDIDDYSVTAAAITVVKSSSVLWDPINGSTNPKNVPGAVVEYCIAVSNASGGATATDVIVSDDLDTTPDMTYYSTAPASGPATIPAANGVVSATACDGTGTNGDASALGYSSGTNVVSGNLGDVAPGTTETLIFRATID